MKISYIMKRYFIAAAILAVSVNSTQAQYLKTGQIDPGKSGTEFRISEWAEGSAWSADDNFFISRVKPKARFTNQATQINTGLIPWWNWDYSNSYSGHKDYSNYSKKILNWFPYGFSYSYSSKSPFEVLPNGIFNSEVFSMWQYISTWGAWSDHFMRMPGNFADVAHKNGVAVATQSTTAFGADMSTCGWGDVYMDLGATADNRDKVIRYLDYYGIDGIGYNSEFAGGYASMGVPEIVELNKAVSKHFASKYTGDMKSFAAENIWYDGVTMTGGPTFDNGVCEDTEVFFGDSENKASSYFLNYNWNANFNNGNNEYLPQTLEYAANTLKRNPFDVYATFDLQGGSPKLTGNGEINGRWQYLDEKAVSIGLWSGHDSNTFWENRFLYGSTPTETQHTYQKLLERWFTNSRFNPVHAVNPNLEVDENIDNSLNTDFFGMSKFTAAQSTLCWDLSIEPFISCFNLGNGQYFNWQGVRQHSKEWFNIGVQDYLPTWRWWWAAEPLSREFNNIPDGLSAYLDWNEAWFGGSSLRIKGTESRRGVLHLFKTEFELKAGDVITVRYKVTSGTADCALMLGYGKECDEWSRASDYRFINSNETRKLGWQTKQFIVGTDKKLAMIALQIENASELDVNIGEVSIKRGEYPSPDKPLVTHAELLSCHMQGLDAKVVFDMNASEGNRQGHYNIDHNVTFYNLYAKTIYPDREDITLMGSTTSWAGLVFSAPYDLQKAAGQGVYLQVGVAAVGLDMVSESEVAWSEPMPVILDGEESLYTCSEEISVSETYITDGVAFNIGYSDPMHEPAQKWELIGPYSNPNFDNPMVVESAGGMKLYATADVDAQNVSMQGLPYGYYDLKVTASDGTIRTLNAMLQIYEEERVGRLNITEFTAVDTDPNDDTIHLIDADAVERIELDELNVDSFMVVDSQGVESDLKNESTKLPGTGVKMRPQDKLTLRYEATSDMAEHISKGVSLKGYALGIPASQAGINADISYIEEGEGWEKVSIDESKLSFSVAFWIKFNELSDPSWLLNIRNENDAWPYSAWGWLWGNLSSEGELTDISIRSHADESYLYTYTDAQGHSPIKFEKGAWYHVVYVFDEHKTTESSYYGIITEAENNFSLYINGRLVEPTSVDVPKTKGWKDFDSDAVIAIGGTAAVGKFAGFDAVVDNLQFYNTALSMDEVIASMSDTDIENIPESLTGFWNFEGVGDMLYTNISPTYPDAKLVHYYNPEVVDLTEVETAGYPGLKYSEAYSADINSSVTVAEGVAEIVNNEVDDNGNICGYANISLPDPGENRCKIYKAHLSLDNVVTHDNAEYGYIYVVNIDGKIDSGIVSAETNNEITISPNPFIDTINAKVTIPGSYTLRLISIDGKEVSAITAQTDSCGRISMKAQVPSATYIALLIKDDKVVKSAKLIKK